MDKNIINKVKKKYFFKKELPIDLEAIINKKDSPAWQIVLGGNDDIYISYGISGCIENISLDGKFRNTIVDKMGDIKSMCFFNNRLVFYDLKNNKLYIYNTVTSEIEELNYDFKLVASICVNDKYEIIVLDRNLRKIIVFDSTYKFIKSVNISGLYELMRLRYFSGKYYLLSCNDLRQKGELQIFKLNEKYCQQNVYKMPLLGGYPLDVIFNSYSKDDEFWVIQISDKQNYLTKYSDNCLVFNARLYMYDYSYFTGFFTKDNEEILLYLLNSEKQVIDKYRV